MNNQKIENLLNLALDATEEEREKSEALRVGYDREEKTWELIVKYNGDLGEITTLLPQIKVVELSNEYAILTVPESQIEALTGFSQIEYIEKPKRLYFSVNVGKSVSCINPVQGENKALSGKGIIVAIIDSGIDYFHKDFRNADGSTRILQLWDQDKDQVYSEEQINAALKSGSRDAAYQLVPSRDLSGHGTAVAGIAVGNGLANGGIYRGVAYESPIFAVKLGTPGRDSFPRTTELMRAMDFAVTGAIKYKMPVAINLSFGNTYGSHDGTGLLETFINDISNYGKTTVAVGTGNEGSQRGHTSGYLKMGNAVDIELSVAPYETGFGVQLWKFYEDMFDVWIISPGGISVGPISSRLGPQRIRFKDTTLLLYYGEPSPYSSAQEIYMDFIPKGNYIESGIWKIRLVPKKIVTGQYDFWLPSAGILNRATRFLNPVPDKTLTIPSTAANVITVAAYDDISFSYADFSGRGYTRRGGSVKPDLSAPGVNIITSAVGGGYEAVTGTSFAVPFVTGSAALMMEWGIIVGNDPFLYGEKVKAYLIRGAQPLPGETDYPNPKLGFGILCLARSFP
ncbi:MAG: S8 family peptidase [Clostridium sp.]